MKKTKTISIILMVIAICGLIGNGYLQSMTIPETESAEKIEVDGFEEASKIFADRIDINKTEGGDYTQWSSDFASEDLGIGLEGYDVAITYKEGLEGREAIAVAINRSTGEVTETNYEFTEKEDCSTGIIFNAEGTSYDATEIVKATENCFFWFAAIPLAKLFAAAIGALFIVASVPLVLKAFETIGTALYDKGVNYHKTHSGISLPKKDVKTVVWNPVAENVCVAVQDECLLAIMIGKNTYSVTSAVELSKARNWSEGFWYPAILTKKSTNEVIPPVIIHTQLPLKVVKALMGNKGSNSGSDLSYYINVFTPAKYTAVKMMTNTFHGYCDDSGDIFPHLHHPAHTWKDPNKKWLGSYYPCHLFFGGW